MIRPDNFALMPKGGHSLFAHWDGNEGCVLMGKVTSKLADGLAAFDAVDVELDAALKDMGLPGLGDDALVAPQEMPRIMQLCTLMPLAVRHTALRGALAAGANPNEACQWGAMALDTLYTDGDADGMALLLSYGADASSYGWSDCHLAVVRDQVTAEHTFNARAEDHVGDTPFILACRLGRLAAAKKLMNPSYMGDALRVAARTGKLNILTWLLDQGADVNATADDGTTALLRAVQAGDVAAATLLLDRGANLNARADLSLSRMVDQSGSEKLQTLLDQMMTVVETIVPGACGGQLSTIYDMTYDPAIVRLLVARGADPSKFEGDLFPIALGVDRLPPVHISRHMFAAQYQVRRGKANPEIVDIPFWREQIRTGNSGFLGKVAAVGRAVQTNAPIWSFERYGRTATRLDDGRLVLIGGAHQDRHDPDYCIYSDVTVIGAHGAITQYCYPTAAFPPTNFHTATLVDDGIWLIGNLGYEGSCVRGQTQVMWLSLTDFSIHKVATSGHPPGWIYGHEVTSLDGAIHISGGKTEPGGVDLKGAYILDLNQRVWHSVN